MGASLKIGQDVARCLLSGLKLTVDVRLVKMGECRSENTHRDQMFRQMDDKYRNVNL